jgi:uncharacterized PurR-regulated membrane protein YhhQ (DUF165 family)
VGAAAAFSLTGDFHCAVNSTRYRPRTRYFLIRTHRGNAVSSMIGTIVKFSVSLAAVAASLLAISWIGLALLGFYNAANKGDRLQA